MPLADNLAPDLLNCIGKSGIRPDAKYCNSDVDQLRNNSATRGRETAADRGAAFGYGAAHSAEEVFEDRNATLADAPSLWPERHADCGCTQFDR